MFRYLILVIFVFLNTFGTVQGKSEQEIKIGVFLEDLKK